MMSPRMLLSPLGVSLVCIVVTVVALVGQVPALLTAALGAKSSESDLADHITRLVSEHENESALYVDRYTGRSPFFTPDAPPIQRIETNEDQPEIVQEPKGPAPTYGGSLKTPNWILGDTVYFASGSSVTKVKVGQTVLGVRLVEVHPPWTVKVAWTAPSTPTARYDEGLYDLYVFPKGEASGSLLDEPPSGDGTHPGLRIQPPGGEDEEEIVEDEMIDEGDAEALNETEEEDIDNEEDPGD